MTVSKFVQPDWTSETMDSLGAQAWMADLESAIAVLQHAQGDFASYCNVPPDMSVNISSGTIFSPFNSVNNEARLRRIELPLTGLTSATPMAAPVYGNGIWITPVGLGLSGSYCLRSTDEAESWSVQNLPSSGNWEAAFGNGLFVMVSNYSANALSSPDGIAWTPRTLPSNTTWGRVAFGNGIFVAASDTTAFATSTDGINWTGRTLSAAQTATTLTFANGMFVLMNPSARTCITSTDGINWTSAGTLPASFGYNCPAYGNGVWMHFTSSQIYTSTNLTTWVNRASFGGFSITSVAFLSGKFVITSGSQSVVKISSDGVAWYSYKTPSYTYLYNVRAANNRFLFMPWSSTIYSPFCFTAHQSDLALTDEPVYQVVSDAVQVGGSVALTAATNSPCIDRVCVDPFSGQIRVIVGTESLNPVAPAYPEGMVPVCSIQLTPGQSVITNAHITDERQLNTTTYAQPPDIYDVPGTYSITRPSWASSARVTLIGAGGGAGGSAIIVGTANYYGGGGGGGGAILLNLPVLASTFSITVGTGGAAGTDGSYGSNDSVAGYAGTASSITFGSTTISVNPGSGGARGVTTPAVGAGGAGGTAPTGGFAGGAGSAGQANTSTTNQTLGGYTGEQLSLGVPTLSGVQARYGAGGSACGNNGPKRGSDGFIMIEWL